MSERRGAGTVPLFLVGMAAAVGAETAVGLLVYTSPGLLQALTVILGVELAAFGAGLATRPADGRRGGRWRWFVALGAFLIAGMSSLFWSFNADFMATWTTRGASLAALAALPMYASGLLVSGVRRGGTGSGAGVPVALGATVGVALFGLVLFDRLQPFGIWLFGVLCISTAAFITAGQAAIEAREAVVRAREELNRNRSEIGSPRVVPRLIVTPAVALPGERIASPADLAP